MQFCHFQANRRRVLPAWMLKILVPYQRKQDLTTKSNWLPRLSFWIGPQQLVMISLWWMTTKKVLGSCAMPLMVLLWRKPITRPSFRITRCQQPSENNRRNAIIIFSHPSRHLYTHLCYCCCWMSSSMFGMSWNCANKCSLARAMSIVISTNPICDFSPIFLQLDDLLNSCIIFGRLCVLILIPARATPNIIHMVYNEKKASRDIEWKQSSVLIWCELISSTSSFLFYFCFHFLLPYVYHVVKLFIESFYRSARSLNSINYERFKKTGAGELARGKSCTSLLTHCSLGFTVNHFVLFKYLCILNYEQMELKKKKKSGDLKYCKVEKNRARALMVFYRKS